MTHKPVVYRLVLKLVAKSSQVETGNTPHPSLCPMTGSSVGRILCRQHLKTLEHSFRGFGTVVLHQKSTNATWSYSVLQSHIIRVSKMTLLPQGFPPVGVWSLIMQFSRLMACYVSNGPLFQPGSCWGDARPQQSWCVKQLNASSPSNAKMTHLPMSWLQLCGGTQLNTGERSHVCSHTRMQISLTDLNELHHGPWGDGKCFHTRIDNVVSARSQHVRLQAGSERDVPGCWRGSCNRAEQTHISSPS